MNPGEPDPQSGALTTLPRPQSVRRDLNSQSHKGTASLGQRVYQLHHSPKNKKATLSSCLGLFIQDVTLYSFKSSFYPSFPPIINACFARSELTHDTPHPWPANIAAFESENAFAVIMKLFTKFISVFLI